MPFLTMLSKTNRARLLVTAEILPNNSFGKSGTSDIEQFLRWNPQCNGDLRDVQEADISLAPLTAADISTVQIAGQGQRLLRKPLLLSQAADPLTEVLFNLGFTPLVHLDTIESSWMTISLRTLRISRAV